MKVILLDIDGTLVRGFKRKDERFWENLLKDFYGFDGDFVLEKVVSHGSTHKQLVFQTLSDDGFDLDKLEETWPSFKKVFVERYLSSLESSEAFGDAKEILDYLNENGFKLGLITGNLKEIAFAKLKLAGLDEYFSFGGFGDNINREMVAKEAVKGFKDEEVFLIGDTLKDVEAGNLIGAKTIGVATGVYSKEELKNFGADFVIRSLSELKEILK